ncbi:MAG: hypothetical protein M1503_09890 [Thaumarchaeota archaeon]|nr:hypothetical protein [Nitrososphaerota archaeon]MCL5318551.1 hypothetical protein [Nitrososphaerota archaeon]
MPQQTQVSTTTATLPSVPIPGCAHTPFSVLLHAAPQYPIERIYQQQPIIHKKILFKHHKLSRSYSTPKPQTTKQTSSNFPFDHHSSEGDDPQIWEAFYPESYLRLRLRHQIYGTGQIDWIDVESPTN